MYPCSCNNNLLYFPSELHLHTHIYNKCASSMGTESGFFLSLLQKPRCIIFLVFFIQPFGYQAVLTTVFQYWYFSVCKELFFLSYGAIQIKWCSYYCCQSNQTLDHVQCSSVSGSILILYASFHCHSLGLLITQASEQNVPSLSLISHKKKTDKQRWLTIRLRIIRSSVTSRGSCTSHY